MEEKKKDEEEKTLKELIHELCEWVKEVMKTETEAKTEYRCSCGEKFPGENFNDFARHHHSCTNRRKETKGDERLEDLRDELLEEDYITPAWDVKGTDETQREAVGKTLIVYLTRAWDKGRADTRRRDDKFFIGLVQHHNKMIEQLHAAYMRMQEDLE